MDVINLLTLLYGRAYWADARKMIAMSGLSPAQGWEKTLERYADEDTDQEAVDSLSDFVKAHMISGDKSLQLYKFNLQQRALLLARYSSARVANADLADSFPSIRSLGSYSGLSEQPRLIYKEENEDGHYFFFGSVRTYEHREKLEISSFPDSVQSRFRGYTDVYGVRNVDHDAIDVIWVPSRGRVVVVASDSPREAGGAFCERGHVALRHFIRTALGEDVSPLNLFHGIENVYRSDWGKIVELSFTTETGSVKNEKMRLRKVCLRKELFHKGGVAAVSDNISPFHVSVDWLSGFGDDAKWRPEMTLHSGVRVLHSPNPSLYSAILRHSLSARDLKVLKSRLVRLIKRQ
ncbi:MAG: hypothetical protein JNM58_14940 [Xanthomonadaceae bacterium]|nr:hypothetical protein [Xanthomonadaceae bacterium]